MVESLEKQEKALEFRTSLTNWAGALGVIAMLGGPILGLQMGVISAAAGWTMAAVGLAVAGTALFMNHANDQAYAELKGKQSSQQTLGVLKSYGVELTPEQAQGISAHEFNVTKKEWQERLKERREAQVNEVIP